MKKLYLFYFLVLICETVFSQTPVKVLAEQFSPISFLHSIFINEKYNEMYVGKIEPEGYNNKKIIRLKPDGSSITFAEVKCNYITALATDSVNNLYVGIGNEDGKWKLQMVTPDSVFSTLAENLPEFGKIQFNNKGDIELSSDTIYTIDSNLNVSKTNRKPLCLDLRQKCGYRLDKWSGNYVIKYDLNEYYNESNTDTIIYNLPYAHEITIDEEGTLYILGYQDNRNILVIYNKDQGEKRFIIDNTFSCPPHINSQYIITGILKGKKDFGKDYLYILVASEGIYRLNLANLKGM